MALMSACIFDTPMLPIRYSCPGLCFLMSVITTLLPMKNPIVSTNKLQSNVLSIFILVTFRIKIKVFNFNAGTFQKVYAVSEAVFLSIDYTLDAGLDDKLGTFDTG